MPRFIDSATLAFSGNWAAMASLDTTRNDPDRFGSLSTHSVTGTGVSGCRFQALFINQISNAPSVERPKPRRRPFG